MKKNFLALMLLLFTSSIVWAQRTVTGSLKDDKGEAIIGGYVTVKDSKPEVGASSDIDGSFKLVVPDGFNVLEASYTGYQTQEITLGASNQVAIVMKEGVQLTETVVTAFGIKREKKALGYGVSEVNGDELTRTPNQNFTNALQGKVAGVQIISSGGSPGAANRVVIRGGAKSITGNNEPLYVIDGIPISNANDGNANTVTGVGTPNRASDINPDDIESVSILRGSAASVLYGNRGANGVILITTKTGKGKNGAPTIEVSSNFGVENVLKLPEYQTKYSQGTNGSTYREGVSRSFGAEIKGQRVFSSALGDSITLTAHDPRAQFYQTGATWNNNISISNQTDKMKYFFSLGSLNQTSFIPNQDYNRFSLRSNVTNFFTKKFSTTFNLSYAKSWGNVPFNGQDGSNPTFALFHTPVSWDLNRFGYRRADGRQINFRGGSFDNPLWSVNRNFFNTNNDRFIGALSLNYQLTDNLSVLYRVGGDFMTDTRKQFRDIFTGGAPNGSLVNDIISREELNNTLIFTYDKIFGAEKQYRLGTTIGSDWNQRKVTNYTQEGVSLLLPGIAHMNNVLAANPDLEFYSKRRLIGAFADLKFDYKNFLFLNLTARNEWSSTLNSSYIYPGANAAFVFSDAIKMPSAISFGKVRAGWAQTARDANPYLLKPTFVKTVFDDGFTSGISFPFNGNAGVSQNNTIANPNLKPEKTTEFELGLEMAFLKRRITLDFTYFNNVNSDGILPVDISPTAGATNYNVNSGKIKSSGIEVALGLTPIKAKSFSWNILATFTRIRSEVVETYPGVEQVFLGGFSGNPAIFAVKGQRYGTIIGDAYERDANGKILTEDGSPRTISGANLGYVEPDWTGGIRNSFNYKNFAFEFLFDTRQGGFLWNGTEELLDFYGVSKATENRPAEIVFQGIDAVSGEANTVGYTPQDYWSATQVTEKYIYENNWVKLREVTLGYNIANPFKFIKNLYVGIYGRNLMLFSDVPHIDPESSSFGTGNAQGASRFAIPSTRSMGINVKFTF